MTVLSAVSQYLAQITGRPFEIAESAPLSGGSINQAIALHGRDGRRYFLKLNRADQLAMFEAEIEGLKEIEQADAIRVPAPIGAGTAHGQAFVILEYIELDSPSERMFAMLGQQLAAMHRVTRKQFGWHRDNAIGATPQLNTRCDDWVDFYRTQRLQPQLKLSRDRRLQQLGDELCNRLPAFFERYRPVASLLHGDLWSGNVAATAGEPVIFDPAVYYGDREADVAMTELFGGFSSHFYDAYHDTWPLDAGYSTRKTLYNLYHVLNHFNLFGGGYRSRAEHMLQQLFSEIR